jgi:alpha-tubulin suppressor-like RCC1 family protein
VTSGTIGLVRLLALVPLFGCDIQIQEVKPVDAAAPSCEVRGVSAGRDHTCAIDHRGRVACWGGNAAGQVSLHGPANVLVPQHVELPEPAVQVGAGRYFSCARGTSGRVWCWGSNDRGELGQGTTSSAQLPVEVALGGDVAAELGVGAYHACIVRERDRAVVCWGNNRFKALARLEPDFGAAPEAIPGTEGTKQIAIGHRHSCLIDADDRAWCWGREDYLQLGAPASASDPLPRLVESLTAPVISISPGGRTTCAIDAGGILRCWGLGEDGQLGNGSFALQPVATPSAAVLTDAVDVEVGSRGGCARRRSGAVACWGMTDTGNGIPEVAPAARASSISGADLLSHGYFHACAISEGALACWGWNEEGQLGRGTRGVVAEPTVVDAIATAAEVSTGVGATCIVDGDGQFRCWGVNDYGQVGDGSLRSALVPLVIDTGLSNRLGFASRYKRTCAWSPSQVRCWGKNFFGEVGRARSRSEPRPGAVSNVTSISAVALGSTHTCAVAGGLVRCWGRNHYGQHGTGQRNNGGASPTTAMDITGAIAVAAGDGHTCAIDDSGVRCWGNNETGQLGQGTTTEYELVPGPTVALPTKPVSVHAGNHHSCALLDSGDVFCWGANNRGQLGQPATVTSTGTPVRVELGAPAAAVALSQSGGCASLTTGAIACWGEGSHYQLGNGTAEDSFTPVEIAQLAGVRGLTRSSSGGCAIRSDGRLVCWGSPWNLASGTSPESTPEPPLLTCD